MTPTANDLRLAANEIIRILWQRREVKQLEILDLYIDRCLNEMRGVGYDQ